jgi:hypothetical protein
VTKVACSPAGYSLIPAGLAWLVGMIWPLGSGAPSTRSIGRGRFVTCANFRYGVRTHEKPVIKFILCSSQPQITCGSAQFKRFAKASSRSQHADAGLLGRVSSLHWTQTYPGFHSAAICFA